MKDKIGDVPWSPPVPEKAFDGLTYEPRRDFHRLEGQLARVYAVMKDGNWRTLGQIAQLVGSSEAGVSARLRDLRKDKYGNHYVERKRIGEALFSYRLRLPDVSV